MISQRMLCAASTAVVLAGGSYLSTPAAAKPAFACSQLEWQLASARAQAACEGPASFYGSCNNGRFIIEGIYCYD